MGMGWGGAPGKCCGKLAGNMMAEKKELESKEAVKPSSNGAESGAYNRSQLPELLKVYYRWLFPYDKYFEWLQYGKQSRGMKNGVVAVVCSQLASLVSQYTYMCPNLASYTLCRERKQLVLLY